MTCDRSLVQSNPKVETLEELLETAGLSETVLEFLQAQQVGRLSGTSKRIRKAVTSTGTGLLRAVNYVCSFSCRVSENGHELIATTIDLGPYYASVDTSRLKRLSAHVVVPMRAKRQLRPPAAVADDNDDDDDEEEAGRQRTTPVYFYDIDISEILAPLQSLLVPGGGLTEFSFAVQQGSWVLPTDGRHATCRCRADKSMLTRFATSLAKLVALENLKLSATLALHEVNALAGGGASVFLPKLRRLHLYGVFKLHDMTEQALAFRLFAPSESACKGIRRQGGASSQISTDNFPGGVVVRKSRAIEHFCCVLHPNALRLLDDDSTAARKFWSAVVTPRLTYQGVCVAWGPGPGPPGNDEEQRLLWKKDWVWQAADGVRNLELWGIPPPMYKERFPLLRGLLLHPSGHEPRMPGCRKEFNDFLNGFAAKWIGLHGLEVTMMEAGFLVGRLADSGFWPQLASGCRRDMLTKLKKQSEREDYNAKNGTRPYVMDLTTVSGSALFAW